MVVFVLPNTDRVHFVSQHHSTTSKGKLSNARKANYVKTDFVVFVLPESTSLLFILQQINSAHLSCTLCPDTSRSRLLYSFVWSIYRIIRRFSHRSDSRTRDKALQQHKHLPWSWRTATGTALTLNGTITTWIEIISNTQSTMRSPLVHHSQRVCSSSQLPEWSRCMHSVQAFKWQMDSKTWRQVMTVI